jgi:hypothetical protein
VLIVLKSGSINLLEPSGLVKACNAINLPLHGTFILRLIASHFGHFNIAKYELTTFDPKCIHTTLKTLSDPMSHLVRHYDFPVPDVFLEL